MLGIKVPSPGTYDLLAAMYREVIRACISKVAHQISQLSSPQQSDEDVRHQTPPLDIEPEPISTLATAVLCPPKDRTEKDVTKSMETYYRNKTKDAVQRCEVFDVVSTSSRLMELAEIAFSRAEAGGKMLQKD